MCQKALSRTVYKRTGQKIKGIKTTNNSITLARFINTSGEEMHVNQDIEDVSADNRDIVVVGVIKNMNFKDSHFR